MEQKTEDKYQLIIIGSGCAGLTSAIYAGRYKLKTLVLGSYFGGVIVEEANVENYPGFVSISGMELMKKFKETVDSLNVPVVSGKVISIKKNEDKNKFNLTTDENKTYCADAVLVSCGTKKLKLSIEGEDKFNGKGVSYCATCDAPMFNKKTVAVIGGADSACQAAILLSKHAKHVYLICRKDELRGEPINVEHVTKNKEIEIIFNTNVIKVKGTNMLESIELDKEYNGSKEISVKGVFVEIGSVPSTYFLDKLNINLTKKNEIIVDKCCKTNISGLFAAGDVTDTPLRQLVTACGQGAIAALSAYKYILRKKRSE
ncbi:MAG: FAD-dependent oxidoreductase [Candidatus Aenigmarchaeota archaeon]|nr:FAD-dependent oxidoreductase [Candidatus Aenigmarchaeota archaeon]